MDNPMRESGALAMPVAAEQHLLQELRNQVEPTVLQARKQLVEYKRQLLVVESKEKNGAAVGKINEVFDRLMDMVADPEMAQRVAGSIETGKDFNEFVKGMTALVDLRDRLQDKMLDENVSTGKKKRILAQFESQGVKMMVGVETDG